MTVVQCQVKNAKSKITYTICESIPAFGQELEGIITKLKYSCAEEGKWEKTKTQTTHPGPINVI